MGYKDIKPGSRVTILVYSGMNRDGSKDYKEKTGRVVMKGPCGWVLNMGGPHGTPEICDETNFVRIGGKK